jgi:hypothetical protein
MIDIREADVLFTRVMRILGNRGEFPIAKLVGSCYINGEGKDVDIIILPADAGRITQVLRELDFAEDDGEQYNNDNFASFKKGDVNILVAFSFDYYNSFIRACEVCRLISNGALPKAHRVAIHSIVCEGFSYEQAKEHVAKFLD